MAVMLANIHSVIRLPKQANLLRLFLLLSLNLKLLNKLRDLMSIVVMLLSSVEMILTPFPKTKKV